ncbi:MAG: metallophosphoesterase [Christensenella sp.]|nr:metallophosphoesterase [Christensenella sp.]
MSPRLSFGDDGTFTVLILSDLQDTQLTTELVIRGETNVIRDYPADLIVLLGDQLEGPSPVLRLGDGVANCEKTLRTLLEPIEASGIPFVVVFGNHDYEAPMPVKQQAALFESYSNCVGVSYGKNSSENGAFVLPIDRTGSDQAGMALYFFDSGSYIANGDYDTVSGEQVVWYNERSAAFKAENGGQALPSAAFCHIPVPEVYQLLSEVPKGTKGALKGIGVGKGKYYLPDETKIFAGEVNEAPCPSSENHGLFDAYLNNGDVFLTVNGHDHINSFIGSLDGIDIANAPGSSYTSYGDEGIRGARLFRFSEANVRDYETMHVLYSDYNTPASYGYLKYYFSTTTGIYNAVKVGVSGIVIILGIVATIIVLIVRGKRRRATAAPAATKPDNPGREKGGNE